MAAQQEELADVRAVRLHTAARRLHESSAGGEDLPRLALMAQTPPEQWTEPMVAAAADTMRRLAADLVSVGVDPDLLPLPAFATDPQASNPPAPHRGDPFVYDGTVDGLRGIAISELDAVSETAVDKFEACGLASVYDLLNHVPLRYIDRSTRTPINRMQAGETCTTIARVTSTSLDKTRTGQKVAKVLVADDTGRLSASFFSAPWQSKRFTKGDEVVIQGRVDVWVHPTSGEIRWQMTNPLIDKVGDDTAYVVPVYPQSAKEGLTTWAIHRAAIEAVSRLGDLADPLPPEVTTARGLMPRAAAYRRVHRPEVLGHEHPARHRLAYDELLRMQLALLMKKHAEQANHGVEHHPTGVLTDALVAKFPYPLTDAQDRAVAELLTDMRRPHPMHRLLQGDVGAGKTITALLAVLAAIEGGHQAALMAPTEVLATQHYNEIVDLLDGLHHPTLGRPLQVAAFTNKVRSKARKANLASLLSGDIDIAVGTHALLVDDVAFASLGLAVIDEQHRFGVEQRASLRDKGRGGQAADLLVMTATPIPRTAAMTVFGDLDLTLLDELPPGRTPIATEWVEEDVDLADPDADPWTLVRSEVAAGRQAYVVCPLVEESETQAANAATDVREALAAGALHDLNVGLVHGKQKPEDRDVVMSAFKDGVVDVLVATTVIEVGVNVPNATVIVVLDAGRFGMAQLHQLRGRVGRGNHPSHCVLVGTATVGDTRRRLAAMCESTDGFALSEIDLDIRGEGSVFGSRQSGLTDLRVASLREDRALVAAARADARGLLDGDPSLARRPGLRAEVVAALGPSADDWLTKS